MGLQKKKSTKNVLVYRHMSIRKLYCDQSERDKVVRTDAKGL